MGQGVSAYQWCNDTGGGRERHQNRKSSKESVFFHAEKAGRLVESARISHSQPRDGPRQPAQPCRLVLLARPTCLSWDSPNSMLGWLLTDSPLSWGGVVPGFPWLGCVVDETWLSCACLSIIGGCYRRAVHAENQVRSSDDGVSLVPLSLSFSLAVINEL